MPQSPYVKNLMNLTGKNEKEVYRAWKKSQELTSENFGMEIDDFERKQYEYAVETAKNLLGMKEDVTVRSFYESEKSAADYIEEVMTSGNIGVDLDHATMRKKGAYKGNGDSTDVEMDDEEKERTSKEYDTMEAFNEPDSKPNMGQDVDHEDDPEYNEEKEY